MLEYNKTLSSALSYAKENKIDRESKAKNCFRNFFNALLLNTARQRAYTGFTHIFWKMDATFLSRTGSSFLNATTLVRSKCRWNFFIAAQARKKI